MNPLWLGCRPKSTSAACPERRTSHMRVPYKPGHTRAYCRFPLSFLAFPFSPLSSLPLLLVAAFMSAAMLLGSSSVSIAQTRSRADSTLQSIKSLFDGGSYVSAELQARRELEDKVVSDSTRLQLQKYLAFALVAQGKNEAAIEHFVDALRIDSTLTLDPVMTSPKILSVFETAKQTFRSELYMERSESGKPESFSGSSGRQGPTFRTMVFPGWEQIYEGRKTKGYILLGAGAAAAVSSIAFDFLRRDARSKYLRASTPASAESAYRTYNSYYKSEFYSVSALVVIYAYSELDVFLRLPPYLTLDYSPAGKRASVGLRIGF